MILEELKNNNVIQETVNKIIEDKIFLNKCELNFKKIFEDGKIDNDDIPLIINLVLTNVSSSQKKNQSYDSDN